MIRKQQPIVMTAVLLLVAACDGSGNVGNVEVNATTTVSPFADPAAEPVISIGAVSGGDSVIVNGVRYQAGDARVSVDGRAATVADIAAGHVVLLSGTLNADSVTGTAATIDQEAAVLGPIDSLEPGEHSLALVGQTVHTDADTVFDGELDPPSLAGLAIGARVRISGFPSAGGEILATRVEPAGPDTEIRLIGTVSALNAADLLFRIGRQLVDYSRATLVDLPGGMPEEGMTLRVVGALADGVLVARELDAPEIPAGAEQRAQISGFVTRYESSTDFDVFGIAVTTDEGTGFSRGTTADLGIDSRVVVDGDTNGNDRVLANWLAFLDDGGEIETLRFNFQDFNQISVSGPFEAHIAQAADHAVAITVDRAAVGRLDVFQRDSLVHIGLQGPIDDIGTLEAAISLPQLDRIELTGVANGTISGFQQASLLANISGVSTLLGEDTAIARLEAEVAGVSRLDLGDQRPLSQAIVNISGASSTTLNMDVAATIDGAVSGASHLFYYGTAVDLNVVADATSSVRRLGDTRP